MRLMREITTHHDGFALAESIKLFALDEPGPGGANHEYEATIEQECKPGPCLVVKYQRGPRNEAGSRSGVIESVLLAVMIDRVTSFQAGFYACEENAKMLEHLNAAMQCVKDRAKARAARGVLGTTKP